MSPKNKIKLNFLRKKLDNLDIRLLKIVKERTEIIKKRTRIVEYMLTLKNLKKEIVDHKRINEIIKSIRIKSKKNKVDPKITTRIWKSMIWSFVDFQRRNFKKK